jgi:hypothetical protein
MSLTAFESLCSGRILPLVENRAIRSLRTGTAGDQNGSLWRALVNPDYLEAFDRARLGTSAKQVVKAPDLAKERFASYHGFVIYRIDDSFYGVPESFGPIDSGSTEWRSDERVIQADSFGEIRLLIDEAEGAKCLETVGVCNVCSVGHRFAVVPVDLGIVDFRIPSHRGNPRIVWMDDLGKAREAAKEIRPQDQPAVALPTNRISNAVETSYLVAVSEFLVVFEKRIAELEDRFGGTESGLRESLLRLESRIAESEHRLGGIESGLHGLQDEVREGLLRPERRIAELGGRLGSNESGLQGLRRELREVLVRPEKRIAELERGQSATAAALDSVYRSRTWQTLTRVGGVLLRISGQRSAASEGHWKRPKGV